MSDQPPSGSAEPGSPAPSDPGRPADPTPPTSPAVEPPIPSAPGSWDPAATQPQGWVSPSSEGLTPTGPYAAWPPAGDQPYGWYPTTGGHPYAWYPAGGGWDPGDPLVTPPHAGFGGWFSRCVGAVRRGWRLLLPIMLVTQAAPAAALSMLSLAVGPTGEVGTAPDGAPILPEGYYGDLVAFFAVLIVGSLLLGLVQSVGWAAGTWVVTRQAAGEPVALGAAFRYGLRRAPGLWGWNLLAGVLIGVGLCFCLLPGVYLGLALALTGPVYLFERDNPIGRSFRIFHQRLGQVLGRVALLGAIVLVGALIGGVLETVGLLPFGDRPLASAGSALGALAVTVLAAVLVAPVYLVQLAGLLTTYAEQRAQEGPVTAARLAAELG